MPAPTPKDAASQHAVPSDGPASVGPLTRRRFLTYVVAAPVLTVAASSVIAPSTAHAIVPSPPQPGDILDLGDVMLAATKQNQDLFVLEVTPENRIVFRVPRAEVGQGITTALAIIIADEIDARLVDVDVPLEDARQDLGTEQSTGGSSSVRSLWDPVRSIAAEARARLVTAAAQRWNVSADSLTTRDTAVWAPDGRSATYGSLTEAAAEVDQPAVSTDPKPASEYKLIGTATPRIDARSIVTGAAKYALDVDVPDALPTVVIRPPTLKGKVQSYDASEALNMSGVVAVTQLPSGVAVSAKTFHQALKATSAVSVTWGSGTVDGVSDEDIESRLTAAIPPMTPALPLTQKLDATFSFAFVNHAPMEVGSAVADVHSDSATVWVASKSPTGAQSAVASAVGLSADQVTLHVMRAGGSFGRRIYHEPAVEAARVSKAIGKPVKLMWTRNDDMRHGRVRPRSHHQLRAVYTAGVAGAPREVLSYEHRASCVELDLGSGTGQALIDAGYVNPTIGTAFFGISQVCPYNFGVVTESLNEVPYDMPTAPRLVPLRRSSWTRSERQSERTRSKCARCSSKPRRLARCSTRLSAKAPGAEPCCPGPHRVWRCMPSTARSRYASSRSTAEAQTRESPKPSWPWTWGVRSIQVGYGPRPWAASSTASAPCCWPAITWTTARFGRAASATSSTPARRTRP